MTFDIVPRLLRARRLMEAQRLDAAEVELRELLADDDTIVAARAALAEVTERKTGTAPAIGRVVPYITVASEAPRPVRVLQLGSAHAGIHVNSDRYLDRSWTETTTLLVEYWDPQKELPPHDLLFNAIADGDFRGPALELAAFLAASSRAPVINEPWKVRASGRVSNARRMRGIAGVRVPSVFACARDAVSRIDGFPYLLRAPGFHNGAHFMLVRDVQERERALDAIPGEEFFVISFVDYRSADGRYRKYRALCVDGILYPAHLAIGDQWKLHYFSAAMNDRDRAEEETYLADFRRTVGEVAYQGLATIARVLGLDYCGFDFSLDGDGNVILFEANAAMTVFLPDDLPEHASRRRAAFAIDEAARRLIRRLTADAAT